MFDAIIALLTTLNTLSPLAVIALLALVLFYQGKNDRKLHVMKTNDLHHLPEVVETLQRIEVNMERNFATVIAKLNGKH